nr:hypothetical protein Iba_chr06aCG16490 [Ipomoea batatas]
MDSRRFTGVAYGAILYKLARSWQSSCLLLELHYAISHCVRQRPHGVLWQSVAFVIDVVSVDKSAVFRISSSQAKTAGAESLCRFDAVHQEWRVGYCTPPVPFVEGKKSHKLQELLENVRMTVNGRVYWKMGTSIQLPGTTGLDQQKS